jgi:hypothetical protein
VFLQALLGIGQHCAGLAVAAFGGDTSLFDGNDAKVNHIAVIFGDAYKLQSNWPFPKIWDYVPMLHSELVFTVTYTRNLPSFDSEQKPVSNPSIPDQTTHDMSSLDANVARLGRGASKIEAVGGLWTAVSLQSCSQTRV